MTEKTVPGLEGQIHSPNPVELFWEKNRKSVIAVGVVAAVAVAGYYGLKYMERRAIDEQWSQLAIATGLDKGYSEEGSLAAIFKNQQQNKEMWFNYYLRSAQNELASEVLADLKSVSRAELEQRLAAARGKDTEPLLLWAAANRALEDQDWDGCERFLAELEKGFPKHFLCVETPYPVQFREEKKKDEAAEKAEDKKKDERPELVPPVRGSEVGMLRAQMVAEKAFRAAHPKLYTAPAPDPSPTVVLKLTGDYPGEVKIRFYREAAPKHVDNFLQKCRDGFFNGQRIHMIQRQRADAEPDSAAEQLEFGLPGSKDDDRSKWVAAAPDEIGKLDFEDSPISHFPGMVAAASAAEGKSSSEQVWINASDAARFFDGERVVFGRVVEGLELIQEITQSPFETEEMRRSGQGRPSSTVTIESATIVE